MTSKRILLTENQLNCPHPNIRVTNTIEPDSGGGVVHSSDGKVFSVCDTCGAQFWRNMGDGEENHIIGYDGSGNCVDCESKGVSHMDMLRGTAAIVDTPQPPAAVKEQEESATPPISISTVGISNVIVSHDEDDPKFQRYPQYAPGYQPKDGDEEVDKRGNPVNRKKKGIS